MKRYQEIEQAAEFIKPEEGLRLKTYVDIAGVNTIGYGHTGSAAFPGNEITKGQAYSLLMSDTATAYNQLLDAVNVPLTVDQKIALTSFIFNLGIGNFKRSTLLKKLNQGDYKGAANELLRWNKARVNGILRPVEGLTKRRERERQKFLGEPKKKRAIGIVAALVLIVIIFNYGLSNRG